MCQMFGKCTGESVLYIADEADDCDSGSFLLWEAVLSPLFNLEHFADLCYIEWERKRARKEEEENINKKMPM